MSTSTKKGTTAKFLALLTSLTMIVAGLAVLAGTRPASIVTKTIAALKDQSPFRRALRAAAM